MNYASRAHHGVTGAIVPAMIVLLLPYRPLEWTRRCPGVVDKTTGKDKRAGRLALKSTETPGIVIKSIIQRSFPFVRRSRSVSGFPQRPLSLFRNKQIGGFNTPRLRRMKLSSTQRDYIIIITNSPPLCNLADVSGYE